MPDAFDLSQAVVHNSPTPAWPIAAALTRLECRADGVHVTFSKKDGAGRWPDVVPPGWTGPIQYTLWLGMRIAGEWHVAGILEYWHDLDASGGNITENDQIRLNWTYDCDQMARQPLPGERVAFFVTAGSQRKKDAWKVHERSQVVTVLFPAKVPAVFEFNAPVPVPEPPEPVPEPPAPVPGPMPPVDFEPIRKRLAELEGRVTLLEDAPPPELPALPDYYGEGRAPLFGGTVRVTSKPKV